MAVLTLPLLAQPATGGELIIRYNQPLLIGFTFHYLAILDPEDGSTRNTTGLDGDGDILRAPSGNVFIADNTWQNIAIYSPSLVRIGTIVTATPTPFLAMDAVGRLYAATPTGALNRYRADGTLEETFQMGVYADDEVVAGDLGSDQCTMFYLSADSTSVRRYDVCRREQLSDVGTAVACAGDGPPFDRPRATLRVARDGSILVAACNYIFRFASEGTRTFTMDSFAIAPTGDGRFFWTGSKSLSFVNATTGAVVRGPIEIPGENLIALETAGALRASLWASAEIPTVSTSLLMILSLALGALGVSALRGP